MARKRTPLFTRFITLLTLAVAAGCFVYFFFPDLSEDLFGMSWDTANYRLSKTEGENLLEEVLQNIESSYRRSGATDEEIEQVLRQVDRDSLLKAADEAMRSGGNAVDTFVESLDETVDFGGLDTDILKQQLSETVERVDFTKAMKVLSEYVEGGMDDLEKVIKTMTE